MVLKYTGVYVELTNPVKLSYPGNLQELPRNSILGLSFTIKFTYPVISPHPVKCNHTIKYSIQKYSYLFERKINSCRNHQVLIISST